MIDANIAINSLGFLFNPLTGESFYVNPIGICILNFLQQGLKIHEVCGRIVAEFQVEWNIVERDIIEFTNQLKLLKIHT